MVETFATGVVGAVAPVHRYTSYDAALAAAVHASEAVVLVTSVVPFAGDVFAVQPGTGRPGATLKHISSMAKSLPLVTTDLLIRARLADVADPEFQVYVNFFQLALPVPVADTEPAISAIPFMAGAICAGLVAF